MEFGLEVDYASVVISRYMAVSDSTCDKKMVAIVVLTQNQIKNRQETSNKAESQTPIFVDHR